MYRYQYFDVCVDVAIMAKELAAALDEDAQKSRSEFGQQLWTSGIATNDSSTLD